MNILKLTPKNQLRCANTGAAAQRGSAPSDNLDGKPLELAFPSGTFSNGVKILSKYIKYMD